MKKILAVLLAVMILLSVTACGGKKADDKPSGYDRPLNVVVTGDSGSLLPLSMSGDGGMQSACLTYMDDLFGYEDDKTTLKPNLVTGYDTVSDIEYTMHLREGVTFSNGNPFTAEDVLFSMNLVASNPLHALAVKSVDFEKTNIIDDHTIDLWLTKYDVGHWHGFCIMICYDAESFDENKLALEPVGTGAYKVKEYVTNSHLTVEAREGYWGDAPKIKEITFKVIGEEAQRVNALTPGDVDISRVPLKDVDYVKSLGKYDVTICNAGQCAVAFFSMAPNGLLNTPEKRAAICYTINGNQVNDVVYSGQSDIVGWPLTEEMTDLKDDMLNLADIYADAGNLEKAKALAEKNGLIGKTIRIISNGEQQYITTAELIQSNLREIGMDAEIINYDAASFMSILYDPSNYEIALWFTSSPSYSAVDSLNMYPQFITLGWEGPERDEYLELSTKAVSTVSDAEREPMLRRLIEIHEEQIPWFGYCEQVFAIVSNKDIQGLHIASNGSINYGHCYWPDN